VEAFNSDHLLYEAQRGYAMNRDHEPTFENDDTNMYGTGHQAGHCLYLGFNSAKVLELEAIDAKIRAGERLVAEQELRIGRLRRLGIDESPSMKLLQQFNLSLDVLMRTRSILLREIEGTLPS
jgi:hypothetical protein